MKLIRRRKGSTRASKPITITFHPNYAGQNGLDDLTIVTETEYITLQFESEEEVRELLSQAHIVHSNWRP